MSESYLMPTPESANQLFLRNIEGEVVMLNLLRFRQLADYSGSPELAPDKPLSGRAAYQKYMDHAKPFLENHGGSLMYMGEGGDFLIGPAEERWDLVLLVRQPSLADFKAFTSNQAYLAGLGHRTAALSDSRLLPLVDA